MPKIVDAEERRAELAHAAANLIARSGVGAATLRDVAAEAGWTTGALTHYFADKRELLLFTFQASLTGRHAIRQAREQLAPLDALVASLEGALPLDDDRRRHWMVAIAFCAQAAGDDDLSAAQRDAYRDFRAQVAGHLERGALAAGHSAGQLAERLIAMADGIAIQAVFDPASRPAEHQLEQLRQLIDPLLAMAG